MSFFESKILLTLLVICMYNIIEQLTFVHMDFVKITMGRRN